MPDQEKNKFISDCISKCIKDGKSQEQAAAICYSKWDEAKKSEAENNIKEVKKCLKL